MRPWLKVVCPEKAADQLVLDDCVCRRGGSGGGGGGGRVIKRCVYSDR